MITNYKFIVFLVIIVNHSYARNQEDLSTHPLDLEAGISGVLRVIGSLELRNQQARARTEYFIEHCGAELLEVVKGEGIVGDMQIISKQCEKETDEKWTQIYGSFQTDIEWAEPAALRAIDAWFACLPIATQQNALAEYYLEQLLNIVSETILKMKQVIIDKEDESMADLNQNLEQMLRLNVVALEDIDNVNVYQTLFENQYRTACALTKISSDNLYNQNGILISGAAHRALQLMKATIAIEI